MLGHLHWDHTQGLPFFAGADRPDARTDLYMPAQGDAEEVLRRVMSPPHFPITPGRAARHVALPRARARRARRDGGLHRPRPGDPPQGGPHLRLPRLRRHRHRWRTSPTTVLPPSGPGPDGLGEYHEAALDLAQRLDLLIHDAQYLDDELAARASFGHASAGYAVALGRRAGARRVLLFHHDPPRTDDDIDALVASYAAGPVPVDGGGRGHGHRPPRRPGAAETESARRGLLAYSAGPWRCGSCLAEDNYLVREGVRTLIETEPDLDVVGCCEDYDSLIATVDEQKPDVVVTDIRMPPTGTDEGIRAAEVLRQRHPDMGVVVLSQYSEPAYAVAFLDGGSKGRAYLLKERVSDIGQLAGAIREVAAGGSVIDPEVVDALVSARAQARRLPPAPAHGARERDPVGDGPGQEQRRGGLVPRAFGAGRREAHQLDLLQAGVVAGARRPPPRQGGAPLPLRPGGVTGPVARRGGAATTAAWVLSALCLPTGGLRG